MQIVTKAFEEKSKSTWAGLDNDDGDDGDDDDGDGGDDIVDNGDVNDNDDDFGWGDNTLPNKESEQCSQLQASQPEIVNFYDSFVEFRTAFLSIYLDNN